MAISSSFSSDIRWMLLKKDQKYKVHYKDDSSELCLSNRDLIFEKKDIQVYYDPNFFTKRYQYHYQVEQFKNGKQVMAISWEENDT